LVEFEEGCLRGVNLSLDGKSAVMVEDVLEQLYDKLEVALALAVVLRYEQLVNCEILLRDSSAIFWDGPKV
jgi:hypothetical protein